MSVFGLRSQQEKLGATAKLIMRVHTRVFNARSGREIVFLRQRHQLCAPTKHYPTLAKGLVNYPPYFLEIDPSPCRAF